MNNSAFHNKLQTRGAPAKSALDSQQKEFNQSDIRKIQSELSVARQRLLDLTMRNRFLNYRTSKRRSIRFENGSHEKAYKTLIINEKPLKLISDNSQKRKIQRLMKIYLESFGVKENSLLLRHPYTKTSSNHLFLMRNYLLVYLM